MLKHIVCIKNMLDGIMEKDDNLVTEKCLDAYNYCVLIEAVKTELLR
jgi:hypothetical protein